ncbi:MAG: hypothetical protein LAN64_16635 [Acidobacteriia bacterium]|nr:hypothetical protein [Terriglobia bacterium]
MASPQLIPRLDPSKPIFTPTTPDFTGTAQQQLGDLGTGNDGFDALFALPAGAIDLDTAALNEFDPMLAAMDFDAGAFASVYHTPVDGALPGFLSDGEALNAAVQNPGEVQDVPVPTTPPVTPPSETGSDVNQHVYRTFPYGEPGQIVTIDPLPLGGPTGSPPQPFPGPKPPPIPVGPPESQ